MCSTRVSTALVLLIVLIASGCGQQSALAPARSDAPLPTTSSTASAQVNSIQAAIDRAGANGTVTIAAGVANQLTSPLTIAVPNFTLRCEPGAALTKAFNGNMLTITADGVTVEGCTFDGAHAHGFAGNGVLVIGASGVTLRRVTANNNAGIGIYLINAAGFTVEASTAVGNRGEAMFGETTAGGTLGPGIFHDNVADSSGGTEPDLHAIAVHSTAAGSHVQDIKALNNTLTRGTGFCFEAWKGTGERPTDIVVEGNTCGATANGDGGYSLSEVDRGSVGSNRYDANGFAGFAYELAGSNEISVMGNAANGTDTTLHCASVDRSSNNMLANNRFSGCTFGVYIGSTPAASASNNQVIGNTITLKSGAGAYGVWLQANNPSATVNNNLIVSNIITGDRTDGQVAVQLERDSGTLSETRVRDNVIANVATVFNEESDVDTWFIANQFSGYSVVYAGNPGPGCLRFDTNPGP